MLIHDEYFEHLVISERVLFFLHMQSTLRMQFYMCGCFFSANLFIKEYKMHVTFNGRDQFLREYGEVGRVEDLLRPKTSGQGLR